jgi:GT2 family glycosyltransferase
VAPHVDIVICTMNRRQKLETCLDHLRDLRYNNWDLILVDSGDDADLADQFSDLPLTYVDAPARGLPNARNRALVHCDGEIVCFIDDDAYVEPSWLTHIVAEFEDSGVGAVGGPVVDLGEGLRAVTPVAELRANGEIIDNFDSSVRATVDHIRGANMHYRRELLEELGGFDEGYSSGGRAHFEDTDMSHRVRRAGYKLVYTPAAPVVHDHGFRGSDDYQAARLRNWPRLYRRVDHGVADAVSFFFRYLVRCLFFSLQARRPMFGNALGAVVGGEPSVENTVRE